MEVYLLIPIYSGLLIVVCGWVWLLACAFRVGIWWGLGGTLFPPVALWFALRHAQRAVGPLVLLLAAGVCIMGPALYLLAVPPSTAMEESSGNESRLWSLTRAAVRSDAVHEWVESRAYFLQVGAIPVIASAWIWLLVRAFRERKAWGWSSLFLPPVGLAFAARHPRRGSRATRLAASGSAGCRSACRLYIVCSRRSWPTRQKCRWRAPCYIHGMGSG